MTSMRTVSSADNFIYKGFNSPVAAGQNDGSSLSDFVSSYLRDLEKPAWIGLSDTLVENQYAWSDGFSPVLYTNWAEKEPNNAGGAVRFVIKPRLCD